jgi:hypothetical protein
MEILVLEMEHKPGKETELQPYRKEIERMVSNLRELEMHPDQTGRGIETASIDYFLKIYDLKTTAAMLHEKMDKIISGQTPD